MYMAMVQPSVLSKHLKEGLKHSLKERSFIFLMPDCEGVESNVQDVRQ